MLLKIKEKTDYQKLHSPDGLHARHDGKEWSTRRILTKFCWKPLKVRHNKSDGWSTEDKIHFLEMVNIKETYVNGRSYKYENIFGGESTGYTGGYWGIGYYIDTTPPISSYLRAVRNAFLEISGYLLLIGSLSGLGYMFVNSVYELYLM